MQPPNPYHEDRPWGGFVEFTKNQPSTVKMINVKPHEALSLQKHADRDEFWYILSGEGFITKGTERIPAKTGETHWVPRGTPHRMEGGEEALFVLEIAFGKFDENDIVRIEDKYGRVK